MAQFIIGRLHLVKNTDFKISTKFDYLGCRRRLVNPLSKAQVLLDGMVVRDTSPFVPFQQGTLNATPLSSIGTGLVVYRTPYASHLYYGTSFNFNRSFHPQATHHWFEKSKSMYKKKWLDKVKIYYKGVI